jgi:L-ornithine N5-oxygenase
MKPYSNRVAHYNVLGIGFGPSNLALAIALEEAGTTFTAHFIEAAGSAVWQPGMLLSASDIQNNPMRDLVTPRNPKSHYTFTNYLFESGRLYDFLNLGILYPLRKDYSKYIQWVASHFDHLVTYQTHAQGVFHDRGNDCWRVVTDRGEYTADALVIGTGRSRNIPKVFSGHLGPRVFHFCDYMFRIQDLAPSLTSVAVIGASQSAVEINLDLIKRFPDAEIHVVHRSFSMRQKDTSPFSDHVYFPEFVDYFHGSNREAREDLQRQLRSTNYNSADIDVLHQLYLSIYEERLDGRNRILLHNNTVVDGASVGEGEVSLKLRERFSGRCDVIDVDAVVLATGFLDLGQGEGKEPFPSLLSEVAPHLARTDCGDLLVDRDYQVKSSFGLPLFLNGLCENSHGLGDAGSFSLLSARSSEILSSLKKLLAPHSSTVIRYVEAARGKAAHHT